MVPSSVIQADRHIYGEILNELESKPLIDRNQAAKIQRFIKIAIQHVQKAFPSIDEKHVSELSAEEVVIVHFKESLTSLLGHFRKALNPNFNSHKKNPFYAQAISRETIKILRHITETGSIITDERKLGEGATGFVTAGMCGDTEMVVKRVYTPGDDDINLKHLISGSRAILDLAHPAFGDVYLVGGDRVVLEKGIVDMIDALNQRPCKNLIRNNIVKIIETILQGGAVLIDPSRSDVVFYGKTSKESDAREEKIFASGVPSLVHGDIKPDNMMVFKLMDDGRMIVKFVDHDTITSDGSKATVFTWDYTSPEGAYEGVIVNTEGEEFNNPAGITITPKFDSWGLGVVLYTLIFERYFIDDLGEVTGFDTTDSIGKTMALRNITQKDMDALIESRLETLIETGALPSHLGFPSYFEEMIAIGKQELQNYLIQWGKTLIEPDPTPSDEELMKRGREDYIRIYKESGLQKLEENLGKEGSLAFLLARGKYLSQMEQLSKYYQTAFDRFITDYGKEMLEDIAISFGEGRCGWSKEQRGDHVREKGEGEVIKMVNLMKSLLRIDPKERITAKEALETYVTPDSSARSGAYAFDDIFEFDPTLTGADLSSITIGYATEKR